jgi:hypothetical protein
MTRTKRDLFIAILIGALLAVIATISVSLAATHVANASPDICAGNCYHIESTGPGGCWKDQGEFDEYTVSPCTTASNFTLGGPYDHNGVDYTELLDGTGYCATEINYTVVAEACNAADNQLWSNVDNTTPGYQTDTYWDFLHDHGEYAATKSGSSPYDLIETTGDGTNTLWETVCTSGC